ncbi:MAG: sulfite exporter TauE/SafE family protein [Thermoanaerobaculia bacterium]
MAAIATGPARDGEDEEGAGGRRNEGDQGGTGDVGALGSLVVSVLAYFLAAAIGLTLGLLGGGGSILAVPVLAYVVHLPPKEAIATSLLVVGATSLLGATRHWVAGNVELRAALLFGATSMLTAFAGGRLAVFVPGWIQMTIFGVVMIGAAMSMLRRRPIDEGAPRTVSTAKIVAAAAATGLLTGVVGVGGGFLIVPALVAFAHLPMKRAVGTSLLVIAMNSAAGFLAYYGRVSVALLPAALFTLAAFVGVAAGSALVPRLSAERLRKSFAVFLILIAVFVLVRNATERMNGAPIVAPPATAPQ